MDRRIRSSFSLIPTLRQTGLSRNSALNRRRRGSSQRRVPPRLRRSGDPFSFHGSGLSYVDCVYTQFAYNAPMKAVFVELPAFWLYTLYDKDEMADLTPKQRKALKAMLKMELDSRRLT